MSVTLLVPLREPWKVFLKAHWLVLERALMSESLMGGRWDDVTGELNVMDSEWDFYLVIWLDFWKVAKLD